MSAVTGSSTGQSVADVVRQAAESTGRRARQVAFSLSKASPAEKFVAPLLGIYLGWAVARIPEIFPALAVPRLPMALLLLFMLLLAVAVPPAGWAQVWKSSHPLKLVTFVGALVLITTPLGIWIAGSIEFIKNRYVIAFVLFLACHLFLRDRKSMRVAVTIYVILLAAIAAKILLEWDPERLVEMNGELIPLNELRADLQRADISVSLDPNDYGAIVATTVPLALWLSVGSFFRRIFWTGIAIVLIVSLAVTGSRGAMLGLVSAAFALIFVGATGWKKTFLLVVFAVGAVGISTAATTGMMDRFLDFGSDDYNIAGNEGRMFFWRQGMVWMIKRPWGYGISNFPTFFGWMNGPDRAAHSMWVQYGMELGVAALIAVLLLSWKLVSGLYRNRKVALQLENRMPQHRGLAQSEAAISGHMLAMLVGCLVTGTFLSNAYYPLTYMAFGLAAATLLGSPIRPAEATAPEQAPESPLEARRGAVRIRRNKP